MLREDGRHRLSYLRTYVGQALWEAPMQRWKALMFALGFGLAIGLGTAWIADAQMRTLRLDVASLSNSGITGIARLTETGTSNLEIAVRVTDGSGDPLPMHVHEGACADLNPEPKIPLADVKDGASTTALSASLEQLTSAPHVIFMHKSPEELPVFVACADILDMISPGQASPQVRASNTGSGSLTSAAIGLAASSLALLAAGRVLRRGA
jgi:hypothetical protein